MNRLLQKYRQEVIPKLKEEFGYKSVMQIPRLEKIVINTGIGEAGGDSKVIDAVREQFAAISGQKAVATRARKSISSFKVREGQVIGVMVTLRGGRMYDFVDKLFNIVLPRMRDFRGLPLGNFDQSNNYSLGMREQIIFPEIDYSKIDKVRGMQITFVLTAKTKDEAKRLLELLGMPFQKN